MNILIFCFLINSSSASFCSDFQAFMRLIRSWKSEEQLFEFMAEEFGEIFTNIDTENELKFCYIKQIFAEVAKRRLLSYVDFALFFKLQHSKSSQLSVGFFYIKTLLF